MTGPLSAFSVPCYDKNYATEYQESPLSQGRQPPQGLKPPDAVIFDMDGVLVDSNPFHITNWASYLSKRGVSFDAELLPRQILGQRNDAALRTFFGPSLTPDQRHQMSEEIEANFREIFGPHAKPPAGLMEFISRVPPSGDSHGGGLIRHEKERGFGGGSSGA